MLDVAERILAAGSADAAGIKTYDARAVLEARLANCDLPAPTPGAYTVAFTEEANDAAHALPTDAVTALAEAVIVLEIAPWSGAREKPAAT